MFVQAKTLESFSMNATDGELGSIADLYFESNTFTLRYFVGDTRTWFFGGKVLISPEAVTSLDLEKDLININETKEQIKNSPKPSEHEPVSRQYETELRDHYGWTHYWGAPIGGAGAGMGTPGAYPAAPGLMMPPPGRDRALNKTDYEQDALSHHSENNLLQSITDLRGYKIHAKNGEVGKALDFILNEKNWTINYIIVDVGGVFTREPIPLAAEWITDISWQDKTITVNVEKELIESAPDYELHEAFTREHETQLYAHYARKGYWENQA
ncbi:PRC-barrel domain-containing protein [Alkalicoccobacillus plakortidis]|uniref:PRC-barrel domain-containing protein n=1 Tax=Alkalicoccobacillus plakortidis TaxID=444060 RepID=A0ABT0XMF4_9BACI|nr:PRC-barrel domain-containing protein [Alkalicoccobacillus plakortidis]MCM2677087.1 PRC-barrel domain-containing protein [Alkalicoccobacillus plakortidis]